MHVSLIGKKVGDFKAQAFVGGEFEEVTIDDLKGKWAVFFFYPADFTFICPTELADLADNYGEFQKIGCEIYSVSTDTHFIHKAWHDASTTIQKIKYPMLADPTHKITKDFGVYIEEGDDAGLALRGTFIINPDSEIMAYEVNTLGVGRNSDELLRKVQAAQFVYNNGDQVCPAKWKPGEKTLTPGINLVGKL